jgi:hypothetical protein
VKKNVCDGYYVVWAPEFGPPSRRHEFIGPAKSEAERLAKLNPGTKFHVLEAKGLAKVEEPCVWSEAEYQIPF